MMKFTLTAILIAVALSHSGCGSNASAPMNHPDNDRKTKSTSSPATDIDSTLESQDPYYDAFASTHTGSCERNNAVFSSLSSPTIFLRTDDAGRDVLASLHVNMHPNGTFVARYIEDHVTEYLDASKTGYYHSSKYDKYEIVNGFWDVRSGEVFFGPLGRGSKATYNQQMAIAFRFDKSVISPEAAGKTVFLRKGWSKWDFVNDADPCTESSNK